MDDTSNDIGKIMKHELKKYENGILEDACISSLRYDKKVKRKKELLLLLLLL